MFVRRNRRLMNQINVVPYIDVMLVLLVIFMVTAPLMNPGVIELPSIGRAAAPPSQPIEVIIRANGSLAYVDRQVSGATRAVANADELMTVIKSKLDNRPNQPVVISADKSVRYESVLDVMDLLQRNQVQRVGLLALPRN
ncbi:MAG TPA: protein TolR [Burkholderiales bacterium]|nr:protein TolR [Burkholderiales bacterium]